ncbi:MAG: hypothetical protein E6G66_11065 [Actinobacteria bacterium]|nr:MAG: hypothetical protein E6G66_11065 [Actinomycetota bacterium]
MRLRAQSNGWDPRAIEAAAGFLALFLQLIRPKLLIRRSLSRAGAMPLGDLSSSVLRQYPKWPTGNPGVVRRMQIPEESDTAAEPKGSESKGPESKGKNSSKHRRLASAERDASSAAQRVPREQRFLNRELSRIDFNDRVLALAEDRSLPVLERAKFIAIVSQNIDELFQVRVAALYEQLSVEATTTSPDGLTPQAQLAEIRNRIEALAERRSRIFRDILVPDLDVAGIRFSQWKELDDDDRAHLDQVFERRIFPVLTPLAVDPAHPFPYISNLSLNLAVVALPRVAGW